MPVTVENDLTYTPFGSIMEGSGTRFRSSGQVSESTGFDRAKSSPDAFSALRTGPEFTLEYEQSLTMPVDGSAALLRNLSPFLLQVEPPLVYAQYGNLREGSKTDPGGIVRAAQGTLNPFASARAALQSAPLGMDRAGTQRSVDNYITTNAAQTQAVDGTGKTPTDSQGRSAGRMGTPSIADLKVAVDIATQVKAAMNTPPLILLINPQSLSMSLSKIQQFTDRTRYGYVFHAWGEEQPVLSVEVKCGAFYSAGRGVQWASRRESASWNNLMSLFQFYKNNGYIHDTVGRSNAHHLVGALSIHYDGWIYYGHMSSFSWTYEEQAQHGGITVSLEFTVSWMVDTSKVTTQVSPMRSPTANPADPRFTLNPGGRIQTFPVGADGRPSTAVPQEPSSLSGDTGLALGLFRPVPASLQGVTAGKGNFMPVTSSETVPQMSSLKPVPFRGVGG